MVKSDYDGTDLCVHSWNPVSSDNARAAPTALAVVYHGFLAHGTYPTVRYAAELLCNDLNMYVVSADMRGHGKSGGMKRYLPSREIAIQDSLQILNHAQTKFNADRKLKVFLLGSSMGGTIALSVAHELTKKETNEIHDVASTSSRNNISGVVLLAPMLKLKVDPIAQYALSALSYIIPTLSIIPSSSTDIEKQYRDVEKRMECQNDEYSTKSSTICVGSANTCVDLASSIQSDFVSISIPFLMMIADEDVVVQPDTTLYDVAPSSDKDLKRYPALHGLLCEPQPLLGTIQQDLVDWIQRRI